MYDWRFVAMISCNSKGISTSVEEYKNFAIGLLRRVSEVLFYSRPNKAINKYKLLESYFLLEFPIDFHCLFLQFNF